MARQNRFSGGKVVPIPAVAPEPGALAERLRAAGAGHLSVEELIGCNAMASVFRGKDLRNGQAVLIKLVESDAAYDVGSPGYVRSIGTADELRRPYILSPQAGPARSGAVYYVSPFTASEPLAAVLARSPRLGQAEAFRVAIEAARALDRWHVCDQAHGEVSTQTFLKQGDQILLRQPDMVRYGWEAHRKDMYALASLCLDLLARSSLTGVEDAESQDLMAWLHEVAEGRAEPSVGAGHVANRLLIAEPSGRRARPEANGLLARLLSLARRGSPRP